MGSSICGIFGSRHCNSTLGISAPTLHQRATDANTITVSGLGALLQKIYATRAVEWSKARKTLNLNFKPARHEGVKLFSLPQRGIRSPWLCAENLTQAPLDGMTGTQRAQYPWIAMLGRISLIHGIFLGKGVLGSLGI